MFKLSSEFGSVNILMFADSIKDAAIRLAILTQTKLVNINEFARPQVAIYETGAEVTIKEWYL